jgi:hypothetical protein
MAHEVKFAVPARPVGNADIEFSVTKDGKKFGTLRVSKGAVVWVKADHTYGSKMNWSQFSDVMHEHGTNGHK